MDADAKSAAALPWAAAVQPLARARARPGGGALPDVTDLPRCDGCRAYLAAPSLVIGRGCRCFLCGGFNRVGEGGVGTTFFEAAVPYCTEDDGDGEEADGGQGADSGGGDVSEQGEDVLSDSGLTPPVYIFMLEETSDEVLRRAIEDALLAALCALGSLALVGVMSFSRAGYSVLDTRGMAYRRRQYSDAEAQPIVAGQWLRRMGSATACRNVARAACESGCGEEMASGRTPTAVDQHSFETLAIEQALNVVQSSGASAARVLVVCADGVSVSAEDSVVLEVERSASVRESGKVGARARGWRRASAVVESPASKLGRHAARVGAVVDAFLLVNIPAGQSLSNARHVHEVSRCSGGRFFVRSSGFDALSTDLLALLKEPVGVHGLLRVRTTPEYAVRDVYGPTVYRDGSVDGLFCLAVGRGVSSTVLFDLEFTSIEGFVGASRRPGMQVAFQCVWMDLGRPLRQIVRIQSLQAAVSASNAVICRSLDVPCVTVVLLYKALSVVEEHGRDEARRVLTSWLVKLLKAQGVAKDELMYDADSRRVLEPVEPVDACPTVIYGLLQSVLLAKRTSAPSAIECCVRSAMESASPMTLLKLVKKIADDADAQPYYEGLENGLMYNLKFFLGSLSIGCAIAEAGKR